MVRRTNNRYTMRGAIVVGVVALFAFTGPMIGCQRTKLPNSPDRDTTTTESVPEEKLTSFQLTREDGNAFASEDLRGHVWVASYFFTRCGSNCRLLNMEIARLQREFGDKGVLFVSVSCDPSYDTPEVLTRYAGLFNAKHEQWIFATGDIEYLKRVGKDLLDVSVTEKAHDAQLTIVDRKGKVCGTFEALEPAQLQLAKDVIRKLLNESEE